MGEGSSDVLRVVAVSMNAPNNIVTPSCNASVLSQILNVKVPDVHQ